MKTVLLVILAFCAVTLFAGSVGDPAKQERSTDVGQISEMAAWGEMTNNVPEDGCKQGSVVNSNAICKTDMKLDENVLDIAEQERQGHKGNGEHGLEVKPLKDPKVGRRGLATVVTIGIGALLLFGLLFCSALVYRLKIRYEGFSTTVAEIIDGAVQTIEKHMAEIKEDGDVRHIEEMTRLDELKSAVARGQRSGSQRERNTMSPSVDFFNERPQSVVVAPGSNVGVDNGLIARLESQNRELETKIKELEKEKTEWEGIVNEARSEKLRHQDELGRKEQELRSANAAKSEAERKCKETEAKCRAYESEVSDLNGVYGLKEDPDFCPLMEKLKQWSRVGMDEVAFLKAALVVVGRGEMSSIETFMGALKDISTAISNLLQKGGADEKAIESELRAWSEYVHKFSTPSRYFDLMVPSVGVPIDPSSMKTVSGSPSVVGGVRTWAVYGKMSIVSMAEVV